MAKTPQQERLLNLAALLLRSRRPVPWRGIRGSVVGYNDPGLSEATANRRFERDKATLREMGIPIEFDPLDGPEGGYRIPRDEAFLPKLELSAEEAAALAVVGRFAQADVAGCVAGPLASALRKVRFDAPPEAGPQRAAEERFLFHRFGPEENAQEAGNLRALTDAVVENRTVRFTYYAIGADRTSRRTVDPYGVGFHGGRWYLVGKSHKQRAIRSFRVDRIQGAVQRTNPSGGPDFQPPAGFRLEDHLGKPPWDFGKAAPVRAKVRFSPKVAWMVKETVSAGDEWADEEGGGGTLERSAADPSALLAWALRFGPEAEVLAPPELRRQAAETVRAVREMYAG